MPYADPLDNQTFYTILVEWRGEIRPYTIEAKLLETEDDVIEALAENPNAIAVYRHEFDTPRRDVSEDIAERWWDQLRRRGYSAGDTLPAFIGRFLDEADLQASMHTAAA
jgi:hypothetical protein